MTNKRAASFAGACMICVLVAFAALNFSGCEEVSGLEGLSLILIPRSATLTPAPENPSGPIADQVQFAVSNNTSSASLALPLTWSVSDPSQGTIAGSSGWTALYKATGAPGQNIITVRGQDGSEGFAMVTQF